MNIRSWLVTGAVCLGVTATLTSIKFAQISKAMAFMESFPPPSEAITVAEVQPGQWEPTRLLSGTVRSPEHLVISAESPGRVVELPFKSGEVVPEGSAVLVLFDDDLEAQQEALRADLNLINTQLDRNRTLEADALVSQDQLDTLSARSLSLKAQIAMLEARLSRMTVRAPFTGKLGIYPQRLGDLMRFGEVLTTLTGIHPTRWIDFKVPQGLTDLSVGNTVQIRDISARHGARHRGVDAFAEGTRLMTCERKLGHLRYGMARWCKWPSEPGRQKISCRYPRAPFAGIPGPHAFVVIASEAGSHLPNKVSLRRIEVRGERTTFLSGS